MISKRVGTLLLLYVLSWQVRLSIVGKAGITLLVLTLSSLNVLVKIRIITQYFQYMKKIQVTDSLVTQSVNDIGLCFSFLQ